MFVMLPNKQLLDALLGTYMIKSSKYQHLVLVSYDDMTKYTRLMIDDIISQYLNWCEVSNTANDFELELREKAHAIETTNANEYHILDNQLNTLFDNYDQYVTSVLTDVIKSAIEMSGRDCVPILSFLPDGSGTLLIN